MTLPRLYIFDLDGTLRWTTTPGARYPRRVDEWRLMPGVAERLSSIPWSASGPWLAIASNQCGTGEGHLGRETAHGLAVACLAAAIGRLPAGARVDFCGCSEGSKCRR
jgi:histidinol phosphatase-like enzyme